MGCKTKVDMFDRITILDVSAIAPSYREAPEMSESKRIITNDLKFKKQIIILIFGPVKNSHR